MAYDAATSQLLLFGGDGFGNGTWSWDGTNWTQLSPTSAPTGRLGAAMAFDPATSQLLLFGGLFTAPAATVLADTWRWTGSNWTQLSPASSPPARYLASAVYDAATGQLLLEAGSFITANASDQWTWNGSAWKQLFPASSVVPARREFAMAYDGATGQVVLFGGADSTSVPRGDTWVWTPLAVQTSRLPAGAVGVPFSASLRAIAGRAPYTWSFVSGALPAGLSLSSAGVISGTPTAAGSRTFTIKVLDASTPTAQATGTLTLTIYPTPRPAVWVGNGANSDVNAFALSANGNVPPVGTLAGSLTGLNGPGALAFDAVGELYVASSNNDAIELFAPGARGNVAPSRVLQGPATALSVPSGEALDSSGRLYVTNEAANSVTVYPPLASGNTPPLRTITGANTGLSAPWGVVIDAAGHLWVSNFGANTLTEYAADANGDASPLASIAGAATELDHPEGLGQDSAGNLFVANFFGTSVLRFASAPPYGDVAPSFVISGSQAGLSLPQSVDLDTNQRVYVADENAGVNIYNAGATTPNATISGSATDIRAPVAIAVAPPMLVTTTTLPRAALGRRYAARLFATLGQAPVRWRLLRGHLPRGLKLDRSGHVGGITRRAGRYQFTVAARDAAHPGQRAEGRIVLVVAPAPTVTGVRPTRGSRRGDQAVTISGTGFSTVRHATVVTFGRTRSPMVRCPSRLRCIVRVPPGTAGTIDVTVTVRGLTSQSSARDRYTYAR